MDFQKLYCKLEILNTLSSSTFSNIQLLSALAKDVTAIRQRLQEDNGLSSE